MMNDLVTIVVSTLFSTGVLTALIKYFSDRKLNRAKGIVAEQTIGTDVDTARLAILDRRLSLVEKAHDQEVEALQATIRNFKERLESALSRITLLEQRVEFEDSRYRAAVKYIRSLRLWIARHVPGVDPPAIPSALEADFDDAMPDGNI
jgi:hypothetical protein